MGRLAPPMLALPLLLVVALWGTLIGAETINEELSLTSRRGIRFRVPECDSYPCLIFEDEFNFLNHKLWEHERTAGGGGNWEFQYYTNNRSNTFVRDGKLYIKPTLTSDKYGEEFIHSGRLDIWGSNGPYDVCTGNGWWGCERIGAGGNIINPLQSARLRTVNSFAFKYGKLEVVAKLPKGDWIWPAIWLLPKHFAYGQWPASGEIDLMESRGNEDLRAPDGTPLGCNTFGSTLHWGPHWPLNGYHLTHATEVKQGSSFADEFHKYGMVWDADGMTFYLDDREILRVDPGAEGFWKYGGWEDTEYDNPWEGGEKMTPFDQEFYLIMNVAVGGTNGFFPDGGHNANGPKPWNNEEGTAFLSFWNARNQWLPTWKGDDVAMQIDSVRVWKLEP